MKQMKQFTVTLVAVFLLLASSLHVKAQTEFEEGQIAINAGIAYGFDIEELGLRGGVTYFLNENMRVGGDLTYWLTDDHTEHYWGETYSYSWTALEINGNFHYLFYNEDDLIIYGIGALGIHYSRVSMDIPGYGSESSSDSELGLGIGGGVEYNIGGFSLFAEPKLFLSGFDQLKLNIGVRYYL